MAAIQTVQPKDEIVQIAPFELWDWQKAPWLDKSMILALGGSAGGGKSRLAAEKLHAYLLHYKGATAVASRKVEDDMLTSVIPLMLETVIDIDHEPRCNYHVRSQRVKYENGSELIFKGIFDDKAREGIKSIGQEGGVSMWWMEEATDFEEEDFNVVASRMRNPAADWQQIILSFNPSYELHWINTRLIIGEEAAFYPSHASMNPSNPEQYRQWLRMLTGTQGKRLRDGIWTSGEGRVIDTWLDDYNEKSGAAPGNVTPIADYLEGAGPVYWFCDDGYGGKVDPKTGYFKPNANPRVFLSVQKRSNDLLHVFAEDYQVGRQTGDHIHDMKQLHVKNGWPIPRYAVYDGAAPSLGGALAKAGLRTKPIRVKIEEGVKQLRDWIDKDHNDIRRILVHPRCRLLRLEFASWSVNKRNVPMDAFDHGPQALEYGVWDMAHGGPGHTEVVTNHDVNWEEIDRRLAEFMQRIEKRYQDAYENSLIRH